MTQAHAQVTNVALVVKSGEAAKRLLATLENASIKCIMPRALMMAIPTAEWEYNVYGQAGAVAWHAFLDVLTHDVVRDNIVSMSTVVDG